MDAQAPHHCYASHRSTAVANDPKSKDMSGEGSPPQTGSDASPSGGSAEAARQGCAASTLWRGDSPVGGGESQQTK